MREGYLLLGNDEGIVKRKMLANMTSEEFEDKDYQQDEDY